MKSFDNMNDPCLPRPFGKGGIPDDLDFALWKPTNAIESIESKYVPDCDMTGYSLQVSQRRCALTVFFHTN